MNAIAVGLKIAGAMEAIKKALAWLSGLFGRPPATPAPAPAPAPATQPVPARQPATEAPGPADPAEGPADCLHAVRTNGEVLGESQRAQG
jgi:hypothetical protein